MGHPFFLGTFPICLQTFTVQLGNYSGELTLILTCLITIALRTQSLQPLSRVNLGIVSKFHFKHKNLSVSPRLFQENGEIWILTLIWH